MFRFTIGKPISFIFLGQRFKDAWFFFRLTFKCFMNFLKSLFSDLGKYVSLFANRSTSIILLRGLGVLYLLVNSLSGTILFFSPSGTSGSGH